MYLTARNTVKVVGGVTLALGAAFTAAPHRSAGLLGLSGNAIMMRGIGIGDLGLGTALVCSTNTSLWMLVRSLANVGLAGLYAWTLAHKPLRRGHTLGGLALMLALSVFDSLLTMRLQAEKAL